MPTRSWAMSVSGPCRNAPDISNLLCSCTVSTPPSPLCFLLCSANGDLPHLHQGIAVEHQHICTALWLLSSSRKPPGSPPAHPVLLQRESCGQSTKPLCTHFSSHGCTSSRLFTQYFSVVSVLQHQITQVKVTMPSGTGVEP